jgi:hypothetical protein
MATTFLEFIARPRKLFFACGNTFYAESVDRPNASFLDDHRRNSVVTPLAAVRGSTHGREAIRRAALITLRREICERFHQVRSDRSG